MKNFKTQSEDEHMFKNINEEINIDEDINCKNNNMNKLTKPYYPKRVSIDLEAETIRINNFRKGTV